MHLPKNTRREVIQYHGKSIRAFIIVIISFLVSIHSFNVQGQDFESTNLTGAYYPYSTGPFNYENNFVITVNFKSRAAVIRALVPEPLEPNLDNLMSVTFVLRKMMKPDRVMYTEASLSVPVTYKKDSGIYYAVRYADLKEQYTPEREIFGISHIDAQVEITQVRSSFRASVIRNGKPIIDLMFDPGNIIKMDPGQFNSKVYNQKVLPSAIDGYHQSVKQLVSFDQKNIILESSRSGSAKLYFDSLPLDPLKEIPILKIVSAMYYKITFTVDSGEVVYDYLQEGKLNGQAFKP